MKLSSAFAAPEFSAIVNGLVVLKADDDDDDDDDVDLVTHDDMCLTEAVKQENGIKVSVNNSSKKHQAVISVLAHASQDAWSLGKMFLS